MASASASCPRCHGGRSAGTLDAGRVPVVGLAGNPNTGKSTMFNRLTGGRQHVGNWPGKTVDRAEGTCRSDGRDVRLIDLPGAYSLMPATLEEAVTREALVTAPPDAVVVVVDATNLERNLYLVAQVLETGIPAIIALNMWDTAPRCGLDIDAEALGMALGTAAVPVVARDAVGLDRAIAAALDASETPGAPPAIDYGPGLEEEVAALTARVASAADTPVAPRWVAVQLLAGDEELASLLGEAGAELREEALAAAERVAANTGDEAGTLVADRRYRWVHCALAGVVRRSPAHTGVAERLDGLLTHRVFGIPIFLAVMWLAFKVVTDVSAPFRDWVDATMSGPVSGWGRDLAGAVALGGTWFESLVVDGVVAGVGTVLTFVPILVALYVLLAVLEDTGYMARAAFVMDRVMRGLGLHGKSFLPLLVGFGCNVPGIYATRLLELRRDRILTGLLVPFVSCAARLPVFVLLASVFFAGHRGTVVFAMYVMSLALVIAVGWVLSRTLLRDRDRVPFVLEIPPLRLPAPRTVATATAQRTGAFLREAGTIILAVSLCVWLLLAIPTGGGGFGTTAVADSALASAARAASPVLAPAGLDSWEITASLASGVLAKEVVVATMGQAYGAAAAEAPKNDSVAVELGGIVTGFGGAVADAAVAVPRLVGADFGTPTPPAGTLVSAVRTDLEASSGGYGAPAALALMMFVLIYVPCMATVAAQYHELGPRWMVVGVVMNTTLAWVLAVVVFQTGRLMGFG